MASLIYDEKMLLDFYNTVFPGTDPFYTEFFCLAARKKYMTEEQKRSINLGDTCMMFKSILKEHDERKFLSKIHQADASADYFTDRDGNYIPKDCIVFYLNLNRTNVFKAIREFKSLLADWEYDVATSLEFNNNNKRDNIGKQLKTIQNNLLKSFQEPKNTEGDWLDIDCDIGTDFSALEYKHILSDNIGTKNVYVLSTHGGCHILISKKAVSEFNKNLALICPREEMKNYVMTPDRILNFVNGLMQDKDIKEIKLNQNLAVPLPGTMQGGFPVSFV